MFYAVINPGTEPIASACSAHAVANMTAFVDCVVEKIGCALNECGFVSLDTEHEGRFKFRIYRVDGNDKRSCDVDMPGRPLSEVMYTGGDAWGWPRLYVDKSSWLWEFAVNQTAAKLTEES